MIQAIICKTRRTFPAPSTRLSQLYTLTHRLAMSTTAVRRSSRLAGQETRAAGVAVHVPLQCQVKTVAASIARTEGDPAPPRKRQRKTADAPATAADADVPLLPATSTGPSRSFERELWQQGYSRVAGVDEAGRGPLAGPVVAAACIVPEHVRIPGIDDSKKITEERREAIYEQIVSHPDITWAAQVIEAEEIDRINILQAAMKAMEGAVAGLDPAPEFVLVDGNRLPKALDPERSRPIVKGDSKCYAIAAASIIAKVTRDRLMMALHEQHPDYGFDKHKGYGVPAHLAAIRAHGPCPQHRRSFRPIKDDYPPLTTAAAKS